MIFALQNKNGWVNIVRKVLTCKHPGPCRNVKRNEIFNYPNTFITKMKE